MAGLMGQAITDIWFVTDIGITRLANSLNLTEINYDAGDDWEWISGKLLDFRIDITRFLLTGNHEAQTRIFLFEEEECKEQRQLSPCFIACLTEKLKVMGIAEIFCGTWVSNPQGEFEQHILKRIT